MHKYFVAVDGPDPQGGCGFVEGAADNQVIACKINRTDLAVMAFIEPDIIPDFQVSCGHTRRAAA
jgi:hypothetical protein